MVASCVGVLRGELWFELSTSVANGDERSCPFLWLLLSLYFCVVASCAGVQIKLCFGLFPSQYGPWQVGKKGTTLFLLLVLFSAYRPDLYRNDVTAKTSQAPPPATSEVCINYDATMGEKMDAQVGI